MPGTLLLISDLEGCAEKGQFRGLCDAEMFTRLGKFLTATENKVAFLGDYFDQGNMVLESINHIIKLKESYGERVIIILGNRDINKLRLCYEFRNLTDTDIAAGTALDSWMPFFAKTNAAQPLNERLTNILSMTMGAGSTPLISVDFTPEESKYALVKVFNPDVAKNIKGTIEDGKLIQINQFVVNCRKLFHYGQIVQKENDVLLSHGGGVEPFFFISRAYYDNIAAASKGSYYVKLEQCRVGLETPPGSDKVTAVFEPDTYNYPLRSFLHEIQFPLDEKDFTIKDTVPPIFFVLQALGLKPDLSKTTHFASFVQSGEQVTACHGPRVYSKEYDDYLVKLFNAGIKIIASGHVPHCVPIPLVYTRGNPDAQIIFALNDTSNGNRPAETITTIDELPLCFITDTEVGIKSLNDKGELAITPSKGVFNQYKPMLKTWTRNTQSFPKATTVNEGTSNVGTNIDYPDGYVLTFPALETSINTKKMSFLPAKMVEGKSEITRRIAQRKQLNPNETVTTTTKSTFIQGSPLGMAIGGSRKKKRTKHRTTKYRTTKYLKTKRTKRRKSRRNIR